MKIYVSLLKTLFLQRYKPSIKANKSYMWIAYIVLALTFAIMAALLAWGIFVIVPYVKALGFLPEFVALIMGAACFIIIITGMISMLSFIYFNRDYEFLAALPIKPSVVFSAKLTLVYFQEFVFSVFILLPLLIVLGISGGLDIFYYLSVAIAIVATPLLPLLLVSLLAVPMMYFVGFLKNRGAAATIVFVLLFAAFMGSYYILTQQLASLPTNGDYIDLQLLALQFRPAAKAFSYIFYPLYQLALFGTGGLMFASLGGTSRLISLLIFTGAFLVIGVAAYFLSAFFYYKGIAAQTEGNRVVQTKNGSFAQLSSTAALIKKEFFEIIRNPAMGFQCFAGILICPVLVFFTAQSFNLPDIDAQEMLLMQHTITFISAFSTTIMASSLNLAAPTCISREGSNFYLLRILPIDYHKLIKAKKQLYFLITAITIALSTICFVIATQDFVNALIVGGFSVVYSYGYICYAMRNDIMHPKLDWTSVGELMKRSKNVMVPVLISIGIGSFLIFGALALTIVFASYSFVYYIVWGLLYAVAIGISVLFHFRLYDGLQSRMDRIEA